MVEGRPSQPTSDRSRDLWSRVFGVFKLKESPQKNVTVKKLLSTAQDFTATFIKEAKILKDLQHKNIVSCLQCFIKFRSRLISHSATKCQK